MKYRCKHCNFHWEGNMDTFEKVLNHEKTHVEKGQAWWFAISATMNFTINAWEKLECLIAVASVLKNEIPLQWMRFSLGWNFIHIWRSTGTWKNSFEKTYVQNNKETHNVMLSFSIADTTRQNQKYRDVHD